MSPAPSTHERVAVDADEIRIGISSCLLGQNVRYDGGHKHDPFLTETIGPFVTFVAVCPEIEMGLPVPRPTLRLEARGKRPDDIRLVEPGSETDRTEQMERFIAKKLPAILKLDLCGYILKAKSPSCGMERVKLYRGAMPSKDGVGLFARALLERFPHLPIEEEGRLHDPVLRDNFFERVFAYRRIRTLLAGKFTIGELVEFHSNEKLLLLAHEPKAYQELGRLVANAKKIPRDELRAKYESGFMEALKKRASRGRHANVLQHMAGYFKDVLDESDRAEIGVTITDYRLGLLPLIVPITLLRHHVKKHSIEYLQRQHYLAPHPKELMLRNHV